jgi:hypothetical protein
MLAEQRPLYKDHCSKSPEQSKVEQYNSHFKFGKHKSKQRCVFLGYSDIILATTVQRYL